MNRMKTTVKQFLKSRVIRLSLISVLVFLFVPESSICQSNPVAYYPFNGNANDESGNGHNGTVIGDTYLVPDRFGNANQAYSFDGDGDYIDINSLDAFSEDTFSVSAWFYINNILPGSESTDWIVNLRCGRLSIVPEGKTDTSNIFLQANSPNAFDGLNTSYSSAVGGLKIKGGWYFASLVSTADYHKLYLNGRLVDSTDVAISNDPDRYKYAQIGNNSYSTPGYFNGILDDIRVYDMALTDSGVMNIYGNYHPPDTFYVHPGDRKATLYWDTINWSYKDKVFIYRNAVLIDSVSITNANDTSYTDTGLTNGQSYSYFIRSRDIWGNMSISSDTLMVVPVRIIVEDYDGNIYNTINIGDQVWMRENLKATHYSDGTAIPLVEDSATWDNLVYSDKAYCFYDNDTVKRATYGNLYTWAAAMNGAPSSDSIPGGIQGVCPTGWHLPSDAEWKELEMYLGMSLSDADLTDWRGTDEGGKLKETGTEHWISPNTGATNSTGFTALPGGIRRENSEFFDMGGGSDFWSSAESDSDHAWYRLLGYGSSGVNRNSYYKNGGFSVRCVKDIDHLSSLEISGQLNFEQIREMSGDTVRKFYLRNTGTKDLPIDSISRMHEPFSRTVTSDTIAPGDSLAVNVTLNTNVGRGTYNDSMIVFLGMQDTILYVQATIIGDFTAIDIGLPGISNGDAKWGDYDNDGDLDILLTGDTGSGYITEIYRNDPDTFTPINPAMPNVSRSSVDWGDYDNDGDLDILMTGDTGGVYICEIYRNDPGGFVAVNAGLTGVEKGCAVWGDYDNDGDLDILLTGDTGSGYITEIYDNDSNTFVPIHPGFPNVYRSSVEWGDYDNDGDLDILFTGDTGAGFYSRIYRNDDGTFTDIDAVLLDLLESDVAWGDYDNDGDLDILVCGLSWPDTTLIYRNDLSSFTEIGAGLPGVSYGNVGWGDYDNNGCLDIFLGGGYAKGDTALIFRNDRSGSFENIMAGIPGLSQYGIAEWGDYDNDDDLDILLSVNTPEGTSTLLYKNNSESPNVVPDSPGGLNMSPDGEFFRFLWDPGTDHETPPEGLSYNFFLIKDETDTIQMPSSNISTGYNRTAGRGIVQGTAKYLKNLGKGKYDWGVQSVDPAITGSGFATASITLGNQPPAAPEIVGPASGYNLFADSVCLRWSSKEYDGDTIFYNVWCGVEGNMQLAADTIPEDTLLVRNLTKGEKYSWQITAFDKYGDSVTGESWHFLVANSETEPNNNFTTANCSANGASFYGDVGNGTDEADCFCLAYPVDGFFSITVENLNPSGISNGGLDNVYINNQEGISITGINSDYLDAGEAYTSSKIMLYSDETYYIRICPELIDDHVPYRLIFNIDTIQVNDIPEPNNSRAGAYLLYRDSLYSFVGYNRDAEDWYAVEFYGSGTFQLKITDPADSYTVEDGLSTVRIYNPSGSEVASIMSYDIRDGSSAVSSTIGVSAGQVYYINVPAMNAYSGAAYLMEIISDVQVLMEGWYPTIPQPVNIPDADFGILPGDTIVQWNCTHPGGDTLTYDLFLGKSSPPPLVGTGLTVTDWNVSDLILGDTIYWKIAAMDQSGHTLTSPVYRFTVSREGIFTDPRDGSEYAIVTIGDQTWMAENLKYLPEVSPPEEGSGDTGREDEAFYYVYGYNSTNVEYAKDTITYKTYGVLYNWNAAMGGASSSSSNPSNVQGACPAGWHLPSDAEWTELETWLRDNGYGYEGSGNDIAKSLADNSGLWNNYDVAGTVGHDQSSNNKSFFSALPGGHRSGSGYFYDVGYDGHWWSAAENDTSNAWGWRIHYHYIDVSRNLNGKEYGFSVRCIRDIDYLSDLAISGETDFGNVLLSTGVVDRTIYIRNNGIREFMLDSVSEMQSPFNCSVQPGQVMPGDSLAVQLILNTDNPQGNFKDSLTLYVGLQDTTLWISADLTVNLPPVLSDMSPVYQEYDVDTVGNQLTWSCSDYEGEAITYDVYFGTDPDPPPISTDQPDTFYLLPTLQSATTYYWRIEARDVYVNTTVSSILEFTTWTDDPVDLTLMEPDKDAVETGIDIELQWRGYDDEGENISYEVYFGRNSPPPLLFSGFADTILYIDTLGYGEFYFWKITATDGKNITESETRSFNTGYNDAPFLILEGPEDSTKVPLTVELAWNAYDDEGEEIRYDVYFSDDLAGMGNPALPAYVFDSLVIDTLDWETNYYWKVVAKDTYGNESASKIRYFYTTTDQAPLITVLRPENSAAETGIRICLEWNIFNDDNDKIYYELGFGTSGDTSVVASDSTFETNFIVCPDTLQYERTYYWWIESSDKAGNIRQSDFMSFSTGMNDPPVLHIAGPDHDSTDVPLGIELAWSASDDEDEPVTYDVYFGRSDPPDIVLTDYSDTVLFIDTLRYQTDYFWKVAATDSSGNTSNGPVKRFTTRFRTFTDSRDGNEYKYVTIGDQTWMAENLAYLPEISPPEEGSGDTGREDDAFYYVYGYNSTNVEYAKDTITYKTYGVLYNWNAAMGGASSSSSNPSNVQGACPAGWHLPSDAEWTELETWLRDNGYGYEGSGNDIAKSLADNSGLWNNYDVAGTVGHDQSSNNKSFFSALPGGHRSGSGYFYDVGYDGHWWSAAENDTSNAWGWRIHYHYIDVSRNLNGKEYGFSVRCIRDIDYLSDLAISGETDFGNVLLSTGVVDRNIYIRNNGIREFVLDSISILQLPFDCSVQPDTLYPGDTLAVQLFFDTDNPLGLYRDSLILYIGSQDTALYIRANLTNNMSPELSLIFPIDLDCDLDTTGIRLIWSSNDREGDVLSYDVYFGTGHDPPPVSTGQTDTSYLLPTLQSATTYYWRVVAGDSYGNTTESPVNEFTSWINDPPVITLLHPPDLASDITPEIMLTWTASDDENDSIAFDMFFGVNDPPTELQSAYKDTFWILTGLSENATYYWRVIATDSYGNTTESELFSFTTTDKPTGWVLLNVAGQDMNGLPNAGYSVGAGSQLLGITDESGQAGPYMIVEGKHPFNIRKRGHFSYSDSIEVTEGQTAEASVFLPPIGDYNGDGGIGQEDIDSLVMEWRAEHFHYELAPSTGVAPDFVVMPDGLLDFEDIMVFALLWDHYNGPCKSGWMKEETMVSSGIDPDANWRVGGSAEYIDHEHMLELRFVISGEGNLTSNALIICYDYTALQYEDIRMPLISEHKGLQFIRNDEEKGQLEVFAGLLGVVRGLAREYLAVLRFNVINEKHSLPSVRYEAHCKKSGSESGMVKFSRPDDIKIYPNPAGDRVWIDPGSNGAPASLRVIDSQGRIIMLKKLINRIEEIHIGNCKSGILLFQVTRGKEVFNRIIVKE